MRKIKERLIILFIIIGVCGVIYGIGYIKYKIWRAEHPQTKTWIFFIPENR